MRSPEAPRLLVIFHAPLALFEILAGPFRGPISNGKFATETVAVGDVLRLHFLELGE